MLEAINASELLDAFPEPALVIDPEGAVVYGNPAAARMLNPAGFAAGDNITRYMPEDERTRLQPLNWLRRWADRPDAPELQHVRLYCLAHDGSLLPVRVRVGRIDGPATLYVVMLQDVSEEQARQQETRQAHRLAARLLAISADAIIAVDPRMTLTYANASAHTLFGYEPGSLEGLPLATLIPERYRSDHAGFMDRFAEEREPARLMGDRAQVSGLRRDGTELRLEASIAKITTDDGMVFCAQLREHAGD